jgi:outer membrane autotransporter protein
MTGGGMRARRGVRWWGLAAAAAAIALGAPPLAQAQSLDDVVLGILGENCPSLQPGSTRGARLSEMCASGPGLTGGAGGSGGGSVASQSQFAASEEQRRLYRRLRERREAEARGASADAPGLGRGIGLFVSGEYQAFDKDETRFEAGFHRDTVGGTIGADYAFGGRAVAGLALSYAHEAGRFDAGGGSFANDAYGVAVYGSVAPVANLFVDGLVGYTRKSLSLERRVDITAPGVGGGPDRVARGLLSGDTDADEVKAGLHAGYDFVLGAFTIGPRLGVTYRDTTIDGFSETGGTGIELVYSRQNETSLTTSAGFFASYAIGTGFGVVIPQVTGDYVHEFLDDQRSIHFSFKEDLLRRRFLFRNDPPDRDYVNLGAGVVVVLARGIAPFLNYRALVGYRDQSSHTVTAGVRIEF